MALLPDYISSLSLGWRKVTKGWDKKRTPAEYLHFLKQKLTNSNGLSEKNRWAPVMQMLVERERWPEAEKFAGHSLRAGLATQAALNGVNERAIQGQTGHKSLPILRRYIRDGSLFHENAAAKSGCSHLHEAVTLCYLMLDLSTLFKYNINVAEISRHTIFPFVFFAQYVI